uniref:BAR/IMD domain-containing adapter protein 2 n=1 Tax=Oncorhynchus mykiss TaxID=8022 RepID=A0A8C7UJ37_ONCMY
LFPVLVPSCLCITEKSIMEQFNPCLRNFVAMGKSYEKALSSVTFAAKGYFEALVRMGEMASESQGSKDLGDVLFQMAEVHRQIQIQLEDMLKSFHNELLTELEKKVELDARYLNAALKKYQMEHKSKGESLEKCQAELKKLRRKSQGSKNPSKYGDKEMQYVETIGSKQSDLDQYTAEGYKSALSEERRRYCFLVDRQCAVAKNSSSFHSKGKDLLAQKIPAWQQACADPTKLPDRAMLLAQQMTSTGGSLGSVSHTHHGSKGNLLISDPIPGAKPLPVPPELAALMGQQVGYRYWWYYYILLKMSSVPETRTLPRSSSMAVGLEKNGRTRVQAVFSHAAGDNSTLLSFSEGDVITLLVPEARDGWHYGENEKNNMRGWFPFSYTRVIPETDSNKLRVNNLHHGKSSSTGNLLEREDMAGVPPPDYGMSSRLLAQSMQSAAMAHSSRRQQRPYSVAGPGFSQVNNNNNNYYTHKQTHVDTRIVLNSEL